jgi:peptidoglycan/xylan/chitin deacetylase (PgdA/CDA1 family)
MLIAIGYVSPYAFRKVQESNLRRRCQAAKALVLTYDDGPGPVATTALLDLLAQYQAKATFFVIGKQAQSNPELTQRIVSEGHELASHSYAHLNAWKVSPWSSLNDVTQGFKSLSQLNIAFSLFRPPYGKINLLTWLATIAGGYRLGWWTVVSGDTYPSLPDPSTIVQAVEAAGGGVVLMHDMDSSEDRNAYVQEVTRRLLEAARTAGRTVCTQSELLNRG